MSQASWGNTNHKYHCIIELLDYIGELKSAVKIFLKWSKNIEMTHMKAGSAYPYGLMGYMDVKSIVKGICKKNQKMIYRSDEVYCTISIN